MANVRKKQKAPDRKANEEIPEKWFQWLQVLHEGSKQGKMRKYFELLTIPVAIGLLIVWNLFAGGVKMHQFTWEKVGKVFEAFLLFLIALGFIRIVFIVLFKVVYSWFDTDFKEFILSWKNLKDSEKLFYALGLFYVLSDLYKVIFASL